MIFDEKQNELRSPFTISNSSQYDDAFEIDANENQFESPQKD